MIEGIITILKDDVTVQSLIGENAADVKYKVYPGVCPQPEKAPYIVVRRTGKPPVGICKGIKSTVFQPTVEVIVYHKSYNKLEAIENAVIDALDWKEGVYTGINYKTIQYQNSFDAEYIIDWSLHARVIEFEAIANANTAT